MKLRKTEKIENDEISFFKIKFKVEDKKYDYLFGL